MKSEIVYSDYTTQIIVRRDGPIIYLWYVNMGEKPIIFVMPENLYVEMVQKMVDIANRSDDATI